MFLESFLQFQYWVVTFDASYVPTFPFWTGGSENSEGSSHPSVYFWNLPFWDDPGLNVRCLWIFLIGYTFYKLDVKILATSNEITYVRSSWPPSSLWAVDLCQQKLSLAQAKEALGTSMRINSL